MMVMIRGVSSFPGRTCSFIFQGKKKILVVLFVFERLDSNLLLRQGTGYLLGLFYISGHLGAVF